MCQDDSTKLYAKISIIVWGTTAAIMKQMLDFKNFKNEHKFMLSGDSVENVRIKIQIKKAKYNWIKSEYCKFFLSLFDYRVS